MRDNMKMALAVLTAGALVACSGGSSAASVQRDAGGAQVSVRSSSVYQAGGTATLRVFNGLNQAWGSSSLYGAYDLSLVDGSAQESLENLPVGDYTFCARTVIDTLLFGPACVNATVTKNHVATIELVLQQDGNDGSVVIDSPLIDGISLSDGAPHYDEQVVMSVSVKDATTSPQSLHYGWSATCDGATVTEFVPDDQANTTFTTDCRGTAEITVTVSDGNITSSATFPLVYAPQGVDTTVSLNRFPHFGGFTVPNAQLLPGGQTTVGVSMTDDEALTYAWSSCDGSSLAPGASDDAKVFTAPNVVGDCTITVTASDGLGGRSTASVVIHVTGPVPRVVNFEPGTTNDWSLSGLAGIVSGNGIDGPDDHYAQIQNNGIYCDTPTTCYAGYQEGGYSFYGGKGTTYQGDFYQSIDVYVDTSWAGTGFWIDMTPYHADPSNYGAEHNFRLAATGSGVSVSADAGAPFATITQTGWYTFLMTWRKAANAADPVLTDMVVRDAKTKTPVGATNGLAATSPGGPFASQDLKGNGYVWIAVWPTGFASDTVYIDNLRTGVLPY